MSTRRASRERRCPTCMVHLENCFCAKIEPMELKTKVSTILFKKEIFLPSNTAHLALKSLKNSQTFERGHLEKPLTESFIDSEHFQPLYLFPTDDAKELTPELLTQFDKPINLIVPDGTWRQAKKVHRREPLLTEIPRVKLTLSEKTKYLLRRQKSEHGLCTFEAIAYAVGIIEGKDILNKLLSDFEIFQDAHLANRRIFEKEKKKMGYY